LTQVGTRQNPDGNQPPDSARQRNINAKALAVGVIAIAAIAGGSVVALSNRKDSTPLLANSGATLSKVSGEPLIPGPDVKFSIVSARVHPGPSPETGFILRSTENGPWWFDRVTTDDPGGGNEYVTAATECTDSLVAGGANRDPETASDDPLLATIWRTDDGTKWKKVVVPGVPPNSFITGLTNGRSFGKSELLVASARTFSVTATEPKKVESDAFALFSADCGRSWSMGQLPLGTSKGFEYAAAVTASREGFVMVGTAAGPDVDRPGIVLWRSNDGREWGATSKPETGFAGYVPRHVASYFDEIVIVNGTEDGSASRRDSRVYRWTGERSTWFTAETFTQDAAASVGATTAVGGVYVLQTKEGREAMYLVRLGGDAETSDKIPGLKPWEYTTLQFFGSHGGEVPGDSKDFIWIVGQRRDSAKLDTWSITLPDSASVAP
jgi:hypothetical protein